MDETEMTDLEIRGLSLVDASLENETLITDQFAENKYNNVSSGSLKAVDSEKAVETADISGQMEQLLQPSVPLEAERERKIGKCNLRKSLAWDSAFFTCAGVLDPDELSSMMKGVDKGSKHFLPGIAEDITKSIDSISTLESESLTLESLEADLFEDIRASIQKSSKSSNATSSSKAASGEKETRITCSSKKVDLASKHTMKPKPASKKQSMGMQGPGKLVKQSSGCTQATQLLARNGGLTSSLQKAPKVIGRPNSISSAPLKRASSVPSKVAPVSKVPGLGGSTRTVPRHAPSSKSSSLSSSSANKKEPPRSSSSCDSSQSASSASVGISPVKSNRKRIDSRTANPISSSSILKKVSEVALKKKEQANSMSGKLSSNISPASSISEWSVESSSSISTVNQRSHASRASIDTSSPCKSLDSDAHPALDHHDQSYDQFTVRENGVNQPLTENLKKASSQIGALSRPVTAKPSGLRIPSPKIGFFDGVKPMDRTPKGSMQSNSGIPAGPRNGSGISHTSGGSSKAKQLKLHPARIVTAIGNTKLDSKKSGSPVSSQKPSNASTMVSISGGNVKKRLSTSPQVLNKKMDGEIFLKAHEVGHEGPDRADDVPDTDLDAEKTQSLHVLKTEISSGKQDNTNLEDIKTASVEGGTSALNTHYNDQNLKLSEEVSEDATFSFQHLNYLHSPEKRNEKENVNFDDQVGGLSMHMGPMYSKQELQEKPIGDSISQNDFTHLHSGVLELSRSKEFSFPGLKDGSPSNMSGPTETLACARTPFAVMISSNDGDLSSRLSIGVIEKTSSFPLENAQMENS